MVINELVENTADTRGGAVETLKDMEISNKRPAPAIPSINKLLRWAVTAGHELFILGNATIVKINPTIAQ